MPNTTTVTGSAADLFWGYRPAGRLGAWSVAGAPGAWVLTATLLSADAFTLAQRPLTFVATHAKGHWRWPIASLDRHDNGTLTATLGAPET